MTTLQPLTIVIAPVLTTGTAEAQLTVTGAGQVITTGEETGTVNVA
jgi:hypothetical protein